MTSLRASLRLAVYLGALLAVTFFTTSVHGLPSEITTSVIQITFRDLEADIGDGMTTCQTLIERSKGFNQKKINFVLTIAGVGSEAGITEYYYKSGYDLDWLEVTRASISRYEAGLRRCFKQAIEAGFNVIHIVPHVDPFRTRGSGWVWRNLVRFDPYDQVGPAGQRFSYNEVLIYPAARALNAVINRNTVVEFTVTAEQGYSLFAHPRSWMRVIDDARAITARGFDASKHKYGFSMNWNKICGCVEPEESDPILYNNTYMERFDRFVSGGGLDLLDVEGMEALLDKSDFIGCSGYASLPVELDSVQDMERSIETVAFEFASFGIDLKQWLFRKNKPFVFSEWGLGGCLPNGEPAPDVGFVAKHPFWGLWPWEGYKAENDPWRRSSFRQYRRELYRRLTEWAPAGGGPQYRIDGIFVWSVGTFDVHGIHPASFSSEGTFGDPVIQALIRAANAKVNGNIVSPSRIYSPPLPPSPPSPSPPPRAAAAPRPAPQPRPAANNGYTPSPQDPAEPAINNWFRGPFNFFPFFGRRL